MSMATVLNRVETMCEAITGVARAVQGSPEPMPADINQYPLVVLTPASYVANRQTMGAGGLVFEEYDVVITLYLGPKDMRPQTAVTRALPMAGRFKTKFAPDWTVGGTCFNSDLRGPADNLLVYREEEKQPKLQWALHVQEQSAANA